jgi:hypothetical protein
VSLPVHYDRLGTVVELNAVVVYADSNQLSLGRVTKLNNKMIRVAKFGTNSTYRSGGTLKYSVDCLVVDDARVSFWLLKHAGGSAS